MRKRRCSDAQEFVQAEEILRDSSTKSVENEKRHSALCVIETTFGRSQSYGRTGALDRLSGNCVGLSGWGAFERLSQGVARGLALPWAILFEAFSLSNAECGMPECGAVPTNPTNLHECGFAQSSAALGWGKRSMGRVSHCGSPDQEDIVVKVTLTKRLRSRLFFVPMELDR